jgi:heme A synthase
VLEAALGAGLVLLELVGANDSLPRAVAVAVHLVNTFLLLACLTYTSWGATTERLARFRAEVPPRRSLLVLLGLGSFLLVGASGAIVALGDTLFPSSTLAEGLSRDFSPAAHFLIRLRVIHPVLAIAAASYALFLASWIGVRDERRSVTAASRALGASIVVQVALGFANLILLAPTWLQLVHLLVADIVWVAYILLALESLTVRRPVLAFDRRRLRAASSAPAAPVGAPGASPVR